MRFWILSVALSLAFAQDATFDKERREMVRDQIEARGIKDKRVLAALRATPRHLFVPPPVRPLAYRDHPLPIGHGQTISQPYIVALMTELLAAEPTHRVLEIGTGSGYQAAVLSPLCKEVFTIEIVPALAASAAQTLAALQYKNVTVRAGDGYLGWPKKAPFDRILLTAAPPAIPAALTTQLAPGGRLVAPEGEHDNQRLVVIDKLPSGALRRRESIPVRFVPMVH